MIFIETASPSEAHRARRILFSGLATKFDLEGVSYSGRVIAVTENGLTHSKTWTVQLKTTPSVQRIAHRKPRIGSIGAVAS